MTRHIAFQTISGGYFTTAAQSVFENTIYKTIATTSPNISPIDISEAGATGLGNTFSGEDLEFVLEAYMKGVTNVFIFAVAGTVAAFFLAFLIPFKKIPAHDENSHDSMSVEEKGSENEELKASA